MDALVDIDDKVDAWHDGAGRGLQLHEYLRMTWGQYGRWAAGGMDDEELASLGYFEGRRVDPETGEPDLHAKPIASGGRMVVPAKDAIPTEGSVQGILGVLGEE